MLFRPLLSQIKGIAQHSVHAVPGEHSLLNGELPVRVSEQKSARVGILALGVLANNVEVDVAGLAANERTGNTRHQSDWAQANVLVERSPELNQRTPERNMVGPSVGHPDGTEENRLV